MHQIIAGRRREGGSGEVFDVTDPATGETLEQVVLADAADVDAAVAAARAAFPGWSGAPPGRAVRRAAPAGRRARRAGRRARRAPRRAQTGKPIRLSTEFDVPGTDRQRRVLRRAPPATSRARPPASTPATTPRTSGARPIGVVGSIAPVELPAADGRLEDPAGDRRGQHHRAQAGRAHPADLADVRRGGHRGRHPGRRRQRASPAPGRWRARRLVGHPDVAMVSFTGSTAVGRRVMELAASATAPSGCTSSSAARRPFVVFDDADLEAAVHGRGRRRADQHRPGLHGRHPGLRAAPALRRVRRRRRRPDGHRACSATRSTPAPTRARWSPARQQERVAGFVDRARGDGAKVVRGGEVPGGDLAARRLLRARRWSPTPPRTSEIVQDEVFGPVLVVLPFDTDDEGLALANDTPVRPGGLGLDPRRLPGPARHPRDQGGLRLGQRPHPDHQRDAARRLQGLRLRQGHVQYSFEEYTQVKHVMYDGTGRRPARTGTARSSATDQPTGTSRPPTAPTADRPEESTTA